MNREEERFRNLFQQLREEDERDAPSFADDWNAALSKMDKPRNRWAVWQISAVVFASLLILLGTGWWIFFRKSTRQLAPVEIVKSDTSASDILSPVSPSPVPETSPPISRLRPPIKNPQNTTRRHPSVQSKPSAILISRWRSPTESLLQIPGEQLFKRVPRLDESVVNIKTTISNQKK